MTLGRYAVRHVFLPCLFAVLLLAACGSGGLSAREGSVSSDRFDFSLSVPSGFHLLAKGTGGATVPTDLPIGPMGRTSHALYAGGPEARGALLHILVTDLPTPGWRFALESEKEPEDIDFSKEKLDGRFITRRTRLVTGEGDWFVALAAINGGEAAPLLLARRLSFTPLVQTKVVLEYREPAPACLRAVTSRAQAGDDAPTGQTLERACAKDIAAFSKRADTLLTLNRAGEKTRPDVARTVTLPDFAPDMRALCGTAEAVERDDPDYRR